MKLLAPIAVSFLLLAGAAGCGDGKAKLKGRVTLDGEPLTAGAVLLVRTDGELVREGGVITNGAFTTTLPPGKYRVEINARKVVGKEIAESAGQKAEIDVTVELIPEWYNEKSELTADVRAGVNEITFDLKTKR